MGDLEESTSLSNTSSDRSANGPACHYIDEEQAQREYLREEQSASAEPGPRSSDSQSSALSLHTVFYKHLREESMP